MIVIKYEEKGRFITAFADQNRILIRCPLEYTNCADPLDMGSFIEEKGGIEKTVKYLKDMYMSNMENSYINATAQCWSHVAVGE